MTEQKHTPLPWVFEEIKENPRNTYRVFYTNIYEPILDDSHYEETAPKKEDAEFIVRAVNSHYQMLEALKRCYTVFKMDEVDTAISMQVGMAISKAEGE